MIHKSGFCLGRIRELPRTDSWVMPDGQLRLLRIFGSSVLAAGNPHIADQVCHRAE